MSTPAALTDPISAFAAMLSAAAYEWMTDAGWEAHLEAIADPWGDEDTPRFVPSTWQAEWAVGSDAWDAWACEEGDEAFVRFLAGSPA